MLPPADRKSSMMQKNHATDRKRNGMYTAAAVLFWLIVWQIISMKIETKILFASPVSVIQALGRLCVTAEFWKAAASSCLRIAAGFLLSFVAGIGLAVLSTAFVPIRELISPVMKLIKAVPVASFVILALLWISSANLSVLISFLMVIPVIYFNVLQGIQNTEKELLEMAEVFRMKKIRRLRYIYLPSVLPYLVSACSVGLGFCWKSGIAAEVIGIPANSIGRKLYEAKLYLMTEDLFAWTFVIVGISILLEKLVMFGIRRTAAAFSQTGVRIKAKKPGEGQEKGQSKELREKNGAAITIGHLSKAYRGNPVIQDLSVSFPAGSVTCIMGASGIGKTTLLNLMMGLEKPDSGTVSGCGKEGRRCSQSAVFQEDRLCEGLDAAGNTALTAGPGITEQEIAESLCEVGIKEYKGKPVSEFSGGMKRRTALVRAVLAESSILYLDEPFKGIDEEQKRKVIEWLSGRLKGKTIVMTTHDEEDARLLGAKCITLQSPGKS